MASSQINDSRLAETRSYWNKRYPLWLTNAQISRREAIGIIGTGAIALLAYFVALPYLPNKGAVTTVTTTATTTATAAETTAATSAAASAAKTTYQGGGGVSPQEISIFATGTVDTAELTQTVLRVE